MISKRMYTKLPYCIRRRFPQQRQKVLVPLLLAAVVGTVFLVFQIFLFSRINDDDDVGPTDRRPPSILVPVGDEAKEGVDGRKGEGDRSDSRRGKPLVSRIPGVRSEQLKLYVPDADDKFACFKSGRKIPFSQVNDDYCDCLEDGSDEPSTGACPNTFFACEDDKKLIPSSRVNDMICDCCDGTDEWDNGEGEGRVNPEFVILPTSLQKKLGRYQVPCQHTC